MKVTDLAKVVAPNCSLKVVGVRPGEKLHEQMIGPEDAHYTYEYPDHYKILPTINHWGTCPKRIKDGKRVPDGFVYSSHTNDNWMTPEQLSSWIAANKAKIGQI
jgi:FlaA1/EpsC-like NDP-sugar epimerase